MYRITPAIMVLLLTGCASQNGRLEDAGRDLARITEWRVSTIAPTLDKASRVTTLKDLVEIPQLERLIQQTLAHNPSLQQLTLGLDILAKQRNISRAAQQPDVNLGFQSQRNKNNNEIDNQHSVSVNVGWELDLWRKLSDGSRAAEQELLSGEAGYQAARDALVAQVMRTYLEWVADQRLLVIEQARTQVWVWFLCYDDRSQ